MSDELVANTSTPAPYAKPLPHVTAEAKPFWDAAREHRLLIQKSKKNGKSVFYPRAISPFGPRDELEWVEASGKGTIYSYTVARRPTAPQWAGEPPLIIAIVELAEGARMTTNIVGYAPEDVRIGMAVQAVFDDVTPQVTLVKFGPPTLPQVVEPEPVVVISVEPSMDEMPNDPNVDIDPIPEAI